MISVIAKGLLIPFLGTALGSTCVFFMKKDMSPKLQKAFSRFAAGVMIAAGVWSLLIPSEEDGDRSVFNFHSNPNPKCPVGNKIHLVLEEPLSAAQKALEEELSKHTVSELMNNL